MTREMFTNFAITTLVTPLSSTDTTFSVSMGQGALFPTRAFLVTIEHEVIFIASRSGDLFTIAAGGRGFDGTSAVAHVVSVPVQQTVTASTLNRLWQNSVDTYHPDVPPTQAILGANGIPLGTASPYDNEFETQGNWILQSPPSGSTNVLFSVGAPLKSHLLFQTTPGPGHFLTAYTPFSPGGAFTITTKLSDAFVYPATLTRQYVSTYFFVSDQADPTQHIFGGNQFFLLFDSNSGLGANSIHYRTLEPYKVVNGTGTSVGTYFQVSPGISLYFRIAYDGTTWFVSYGDGYTYSVFGSTKSLNFTIRSFGFYFDSGGYPYTAVVDFARVTLGSVLPPYGA